MVIIFPIVTFIVAKSTFKTNTEAVQETMLTFAQQSAAQVRDSLTNASSLMKFAAKGLALMAGDSDKEREAAIEFVEQIFENMPNIHNIQMHFEPGEDAFGKNGCFAYELYRENEKVVRHSLTMDSESGLDLSSPHFTVPLKEGVPYHRSGASQKHFKLNEHPAYVASTNYPVIRNGKVIGCIGMELLYREMFSFANQPEKGGSHRFIIREDGIILYATNTALIGRGVDSMGFDAGILGNLKTAMRQKISYIGECFSPISGKESLVCLYPVGMPEPLTQIFMYIGTPAEIVYRGAMESARTVFFALLGGLLLFTCFLFAVTRNIVKPIKDLTESAKLIASGQLEGVLDQFDENRKTRDEVYILGCSLQKMLKELLSNIKLKSIAIKAEDEKVKMGEAAAAKDRFFANMSHEIRTPMNVILGMSEVLLRESLTADQKKFVQDIKVSSESLLHIINDILDLSRLESGKLSLSPAHYDFRALVENIHSLGQYLAEKKGLHFQVETSGGIPGYLYGDDGRLRQVLLNIIGNAIKFTEKGGVTLNIVDEGETLLFDIVDTGIGIREMDMQYLFEPFKQIDGPQIRTVKGSGLGLSICLNLVELMGGAITVASEYGKGSSFHVRIPKVLGDAGKVENNSKVLPVSFDPGSRVLVVDDSESNLKVAREFLKMFGIAADTASSGAEAIAMVTRSDYDLVFMDHMMPEMDGVETTQRIRALGNRQAKMPIVALTANAVIGTREFLLSFGINDFLTKPIEKIKLQAILARWLPENLVIREKRTASEARCAFSPTQEQSFDGKADGNGQKQSNAARPTHVLADVLELKDLNIPLGLERTADNMTLYVDLLGMIMEIIPETLKKIDAALSEGDAASLNIEIHTLKGSLANLGAVELAAQAAELEQAGGRRDFDLFADKLDPFRKNLEAFIRNLREKLSPGEDATQLVASGTRPMLKEALRELHDALADFDYGKSMEIVTELARFDWGETHNLSIKTAYTKIKHFDYDAAMSELQRIFPEK